MTLHARNTRDEIYNHVIHIKVERPHTLPEAIQIACYLLILPVRYVINYSFSTGGSSTKSFRPETKKKEGGWVKTILEKSPFIEK